MTLTGRLLRGPEAYNIGLVNYVTPQTESGNAAYELAEEVAMQILGKVMINRVARR